MHRAWLASALVLLACGGDPPAADAGVDGGLPPLDASITGPRFVLVDEEACFETGAGDATWRWGDGATGGGSRACHTWDVVGPRTLIPTDARALGVHVYHDLEDGLRDVDVVIMLRLQKERMDGALLPSEDEYFHLYGLTNERLEVAKPDAIVMHPGPMNRGVEMDTEVADGPRSVILQQVSYGIAVRMAVMSMCMQTHGSNGGEA